MLNFSRILYCFCKNTDEGPLFQLEPLDKCLEAASGFILFFWDAAGFAQLQKYFLCGGLFLDPGDICSMASVGTVCLYVSDIV